MFLFIFIGAMIMHGAHDFQKKYDHCKELEFKTDYCKTQKLLNKYEVKK